jgi:hypothetical protein
MGRACTSPWGSPVGTHYGAKNGVIPWGSPVGNLGPKRGWLWYHTSSGYGNEYVLICIFASFLTQRSLKPWWPWTYQYSAVKCASAGVVPGCVTSWEVWFGGAKSGQYCVIGSESLQMVLEPWPSLRWGNVHKPMWVASGHSLGCQQWGDPMRVASGYAGSQKGVIVTSHIIWVWEWVCAYMYIRTLLDMTHFKAVMAMNLSELRS